MKPTYRSPTSELEPPTVDYLGVHANFISLPRSRGARLFYFFFDSRRSEYDPVVLWLQGGPGSGGESGMVYENGPVTFLENNQTLVWNPNGWDQVSNIIFVDNPVGSGFSFTTDESDICHDQTCVSDDLYDFLQAFFKKHRKLSKNPLFITGESYAGHYIPPLASKIHKANREKEGIPINLKGFAIGNGMVNPEIQFIAFPDFGVKMNLINQSDYQRITRDLLQPCINATRICDSMGGEICKVSFDLCITMKFDVLDTVGGKSDFDLRKKCPQRPCLSFKIVNDFFNSTSVRSALEVGDRYFYDLGVPYNAMTLDRMRSYDKGIPELLEAGIRVLIYAGEYDYGCNWLGNVRWVRALNWTGQLEFKESPMVHFVVDGVKAGELNSFGPLTFLKVYEAGHMVPQDQPVASLEMLKRFINDDFTL